MLILSSTSRPTLSLQSLASASTSKSESRSKAAVEEEKAAEDAPPALLEVVVRMDSTLLPTGDARRAAAAAEGATEDEAVTEGTGREDEPEAVATVESGRISWEPPGLSTEERMLKMENEGDRNVI